MKPATSLFVWIFVILLSAMPSASAALPSASCSDTLLVLADQLVQTGRVQLIGGIGKTQGSSACAMPSSPSTFTGASVEKAIPWNQLGVVDTGFHGQVVVRSGGTLLLKPGAYRFARLTVEWDGKIQVDSAGSTAESALEIQVGNGLTWMDRSKLVWPGKADSVAASKVMIAVLSGAVQIGYDSRFLGTLFAPQSNVAIQDRAVVVGRVLAASQNWGWDSKGWFRRTEFCPSWLLTHEVKILSPRRFWVRTTSADIPWVVDGKLQDTALVDRWSQEGTHWVRRCHAGVCDSVKAMVDWTPPVVRIVSPIPEYVTNNSRLSLIWTSDAIATTEVVELVDGTNLLTRYATDSAGNRDSASVRVVLDRIRPVVKIQQPVSGTLTNRSRLGVVWAVDGVTKNPDTSDLQEGSNWIRRSAQDAAGNIGSDSVQVELDTHPPVVTFLEPASGFQTAATQILVRWKVDTARFEQWVDLNVGSNRIERTGVDAAGNSANASIVVVRTGEPVLPEPVAPAYPTTRNSDLSFGADFLFNGDHAVQTGFQEDSVLPYKRGVLRGVVVDPSGRALPNVQIRILGSAKFGETRTRATGVWDLVVEGDAKRMVVFEKAGFHSSQREMLVACGDIAVLDTVALVPFDTMVTAIRSGAEAMQVVAGSKVQDKDGIRQSVVFIPSGTDLTVEAMDGSRTSLGAARMRITEYTVGARGPQAMPADMPPTVDYTFCADVTVDEAPQANHIQFSKPVPFYVENFLGLPVGWPVPVGSYDRKAGAWKELPNGRIIKIVGVDPSGLARIDMTGDGAEDPLDSLAKLGFSSEERKVLAQKYPVGQSLMRAVSSSFSPVDLNWRLRLDPDTTPNDKPENAIEDSCCDVAEGCEIDLSNQLMREKIGIPGTSLEMVYNSNMVDGRLSERKVRFNLWSGLKPRNLISVEAEMTVAGKSISVRKLASELSDTGNFVDMRWDGLDVWGRPVYGVVMGELKMRYLFQGVVAVDPARGFLTAGLAELIAQNPGRTVVVRQKRWDIKLKGLGVESAIGRGGWQIDGLVNFAGESSIGSNKITRIDNSIGFNRVQELAGGGSETGSQGYAKAHRFEGLTSIALVGEDIYALDYTGGDGYAGTRPAGGLWKVAKARIFKVLDELIPLGVQVGDTIAADTNSRLPLWPGSDVLNQVWSTGQKDILLLSTISGSLFKYSISSQKLVCVYTERGGRPNLVSIYSPFWGAISIGPGNRGLYRHKFGGGVQYLGGLGVYSTSELARMNSIRIDSLNLSVCGITSSFDGSDLYVADCEKSIIKIDNLGYASLFAGGGETQPWWIPGGGSDLVKNMALGDGIAPLVMFPDGSMNVRGL